MPVTKLYLNQMLVNVLPCASKSGDFWKDVKEGKWEKETETFLKNYISPDKDFLDIGSWNGVTAMMGYSYNPRQVYTIEADNANYNILKHNIYNNRMEDKVKMFNACLTDTGNAGKIVGFGTANKEKPNSSSHRLDNGSRIKVKTESAIQFLHKNTDIRNINTINIDIEGSERYMGELFAYFAQVKDIAILLSLHPPFWTKDKDKIISNMLESINKYTTLCPFKYTEIKNLKERMYEDKFFSVIMESKVK